MWRIILSIILGIAIPVIYIVILSFGEGYIPESWVFTTIYNQPAPGALLAPVSIPVYLVMITKEYRVLPFIFDTVWFRASLIILFNWVLYGAVSYFILGRFERFKKRVVAASDTPPPPPEFER